MERHNTENNKKNDVLMKTLELKENENNSLKKENETLKEYNLVNLDGLNGQQLHELELKMLSNIKKLKEKKEQLTKDQLSQMQDESLCIICKDNKKNVAIEGCYHVDICDKCRDGLPRKNCPRCHTSFEKTILLNV